MSALSARNESYYAAESHARQPGGLLALPYTGLPVGGITYRQAYPYQVPRVPPGPGDLRPISAAPSAYEQFSITYLI